MLHIGDTFSRHYPYYRQLLALLRPQVILHTGDLAEEVKVGRIPGTEYEYESKVRVLADILRSSGAQRILLVPGNNDLLPVLRRCLPFAEILAPGDTFFFAGRQVQASHALQDMTFKGYDAYFYGHSLRGETFSPERNQAGYPCRFNALWGSFVYTPQNPCGVFFRFPLPPLA